MLSNTVLYELTDDGVAVLTLNNPQRRNALSSETLAALEARLAEISDDADARVVIIRSHGPVFSSGHDLNELVNADAEDYSAVFASCTRVMEGIRLLPKPRDRASTGPGNRRRLPTGCHLRHRHCRRHSRLCHAGRPDWFVLHHPRCCSRPFRNAKKGHGDAAHRPTDLGAGSPGVRPDQPHRSRRRPGRTDDDAGPAGRLGQRSYPGFGKAAFYAQIEMDRPAAYQFASQVMVDNLLADDAKEGISAFLEKRPPVWTT